MNLRQFLRRFSLSQNWGMLVVMSKINKNLKKIWELVGIIKLLEFCAINSITKNYIYDSF